MELREKGFLVVTGPTASGKTAFSTELGKRLAIEVINADVGQFYTPLSIGTAKPDLASVTVPHHLFNIITEPRSLSAATYRTRAQELVQDILARGKLPVFVGGSLFYIRSLFYPPRPESPVNPAILPVHDDDECADDEGIATDFLWERLNRIDPARASAIGRNDRYRILRALAIWRRTGRLPSSCAPVFSPLLSPETGLLRGCLISLEWERSALYRRIDMRVVQMFAEGLEAEVGGLDAEWRRFLCEKKLIGYAEIIRAAISQRGLGELVSVVQQNTRAYAKRQLTFLRAFMRSLRALPEMTVIDADLTLSGDTLYIEQVIRWAQSWMLERGERYGERGVRDG
ncbi:MAG: tRNA (adenosine(37)-N6)-dimethylallyltransferase MiaA [Candidatus Dependentiae bacterium]|nr:tRNA (adenosine(37)-N6)-dimethylallyltransferase MiaA [Candidatus Dependentiae bacterium]